MKTKRLINNLFLFIPILLLLVISLANMYKVGNLVNSYNNYLFKQTIWFVLGFIIMGIIRLIKPKLFFKYSGYLYFFNVILLILVLFFGKTINGSRAWFSFSFFSFQPSELMKFSLTLYLSEILTKISVNNWKDEFKIILKATVITLIPSLLVFLEPDTGAIIIYVIIMLGIILVNKLNKRWFILLGSLLVILLGTFFYLYYCNKDLLIKFIGTSFFYRVDRILTFVNNDSFQLDRALISIGISKMFGSSSFIYIPEAPTDFIIALTMSNFGIISFIIILICFFVLNCYFLYKLFTLHNKKLKMFYAGFIMMFLFAQIQNIGMNLGLLPIVGLPLPFVSYGGTNMIVYFMFLGILKN